MTITEKNYWASLKSAQDVKALGPDLLGFALERVAAGDNQPAEALISVFGNPAKNALREAGVGIFFTIAERKAPHEYKGVAIRHALRLKKAAEPFKDMIPMRVAPADMAGEILKQVEAKAEAKKAEQAKARAEAKRTAEFWQEKLAKLAKEAEAFGFKIDYKVTADAVAPKKVVNKSPSAKGKETRRK